MAKILIGNIKMPLANNLTTTNAGTAALDAAQGKVLDDKIAKNAENVTQLNSNLNTLLSGVGKIKFGTTVVSLSEETVFDIDAPGITGNASIAINGDGEAAKGISVIAVREDPENQKLKIYLSGSKTGAMRINYLYKSQ